jgi:hypothetical protein
MCAEQQTKFDPNSCNFPVYATQGGGYATREGDQYLWLSGIPPFVNAEIGDPIPDEWGVTSANDAASREAEEEAAWATHEWGPEFCDSCGTRGGHCPYCS